MQKSLVGFDTHYCIWCLIVITARIRRMGEDTVFSLFVSPHLDVGGGGTPSQVQVGGVPHPGNCGGGTHPRTRWGVPHYPIQLMGDPIPGPGGGTPVQVQVGVPHSRSGWGYPPVQTWDGVPPFLALGLGTPPPIPGMGYHPPSRPGMGYPPSLGLDGYPPPASTEWDTSPHQKTREA